MAFYELEVSDRVGSWGAGRRMYTPGRYIVSDEEDSDVIESVRRDNLGGKLAVREVTDEEAAERGFIPYPKVTPPVVPMSRETLSAPEAHFDCGGCTMTFASQEALDSHVEGAHPEGIPSPPPAEPEPVEPAFGEATEEDVTASEEEADEPS